MEHLVWVEKNKICYKWCIERSYSKHKQVSTKQYFASTAAWPPTQDEWDLMQGRGRSVAVSVQVCMCHKLIEATAAR